MYTFSYSKINFKKFNVQLLHLAIIELTSDQPFSQEQLQNLDKIQKNSYLKATGNNHGTSDLMVQNRGEKGNASKRARCTVRFPPETEADGLNQELWLTLSRGWRNEDWRARAPRQSRGVSSWREENHRKTNLICSV